MKLLKNKDYRELKDIKITELNEDLNKIKKFYVDGMVDIVAPFREKKRFHKIFQHKIESLEKELKLKSKE